MFGTWVFLKNSTDYSNKKGTARELLFNINSGEIKNKTKPCTDVFFPFAFALHLRGPQNNNSLWQWPLPKDCLPPMNYVNSCSLCHCGFLGLSKFFSAGSSEASSTTAPTLPPLSPTNSANVTIARKYFPKQDCFKCWPGHHWHWLTPYTWQFKTWSHV